MISDPKIKDLGVGLRAYY